LTRPVLADDPEDHSPALSVAGFEGSLARLVALARAHRVNLAALSLPDLFDQLEDAAQAELRRSLGRAGDWVVLGAWLLWLRSGLLLPAAPETADARESWSAVKRRWEDLQVVQALARWLGKRQQLGRQAFARGRSEEMSLRRVGESAQVDTVEFLWAAMGLIGAPPALEDFEAYYRPPSPLRWTSAPAEARIRAWLNTGTDATLKLDSLQPELPDSDASEAWTWLRPRAARVSAFSASLELAKQGELVLAQDTDWGADHGGALGARFLRHPTGGRP